MCDVTRAAAGLLAGGRVDGTSDSWLELAEVALLRDPLNETPMREKLRKPAKDGLHSEAKAEFAQFTAAYEAAYGLPYSNSIQAFLNEPV